MSSPSPSSPLIPTHVDFRRFFSSTRTSTDMVRSMSTTSISSQCSDSSCNSNESNSKIGLKPKGIIVYSQVIRLTLEILSVNHRLHSQATATKQVLHYLDRLLDVTENVFCLLDQSGSGWMEWIWQVLDFFHIPTMSDDHGSITSSQTDSDGPVTSLPNGVQTEANILQLLRLIVSKIAITDLKRPPKQFGLVRVKELVDAVPLQIMVFECVVSHFLMNPRLPDTQLNVLKNLESLFDRCELLVPLSRSLSLNIINMIGIMAVENSAEIRIKMKSHHLFDLRDRLVLDLVNHDLAVVTLAPLESVGFQPCFRDGQLLVILINAFHHAFGVAELQVAIVKVLRAVFRQDDEQRKTLMRLFDDSEVVEFLLLQRRIVNVTPSELTEVEWNADDFLAWYCAPEQRVRVEAIQARIALAYKPVEQSLLRNSERREKERMKRIKVRTTEMAKRTAATAKALRELQEKRTEFTKKSLLHYQRKFSIYHEQLRIRTDNMPPGDDPAPMIGANTIVNAEECPEIASDSSEIEEEKGNLEEDCIDPE